MPWGIKDVESHKKGLSDRQKQAWVRVANQALSRCLKDGKSQATCEAAAIRQANAVAGRVQAQRALQELVVHLAGAAVRYEVLDGRPYAVATVVPIQEGVLNQYYVPAKEIAAFVQSWDALDVPVNHPTNSYGEYVSVKSPTQLEQTIGRFFNAHWDGARLTGEVWLDVEKCQRLGGNALDVLQRIEAGEPMECSTAFWAETDPTPGTWNGIAYLGTHKHLRPDHLAILPDTIGACSLEQGCGLRALQCHCAEACACQKGEPLMDLEADVKDVGKLRQMLRALFAFANSPDPDDTPPPDDTPADDEHEHEPATVQKEMDAGHETPSAPAGADTPADAVTTHATSQRQEQPAARKGELMLSKNELITKLMTHEAAKWPEEERPWLESLEARQLEALLSEADRRLATAPLTLEIITKELDRRDQALAANFDKKLATYSQDAEVRAERDHMVNYLVTHKGWKPELAQKQDIETLRQVYGDSQPVSYVGNGMARVTMSTYEDSLPDDNPKWE